MGHADTEDIGDDETPGQAGPVDLGEPAAAVSVGSTHTCALLAGGRVRCWGDNASGQLGYGHTEDIGDDEVPAMVGDVDVGEPVEAIAAGGGHTCALLAGGRVKCWGANAFGQLGQGHTQDIGDDEVPAAIDPIELGPTPAVAVSPGSTHTCALLEDGTVKCWGANDSGQLGYGDTEPRGDDEPPATYGPVPIF